MPRTIKWDLRIDWDFDGTYTDESARLVAANGSLRLAAPESGISSPRGTADPMTLTLDNHDGRYSPLNTSGPLYNDIKLGGAYHAPMYLRASIDNGSNYARIFTGVIKIPKEAPPAIRIPGTIQVDCRSRDEILLSKRLSTPLTTFQTLHDDGATESDIIAQFLQDAGLSSGDYTLDGGMFVIPWAWLEDESPIEEIWQLAAACGGRFYCDPDGEFRYENMTHWLLSPHDSSQETLDKSGYGQMDGPTYDDRELFSGVTVVASPRDTLETTTLWAADGIEVIAADSTRTITAKLRQPAYSIDSVSYTAVTGGGSSMDAYLTIVRTDYAQRVILEVTNSHPDYAIELIDLILTGIPVSGGPSIEESKTSSIDFWADFAGDRPGRTKLLRGNIWVQSSPQAATLAEFLRDRYQLPRLTWSLRNVPGVATRRLGDRITIANADAMSASRDGFITAINWRLSSKGFQQDLEVIDAGSEADGTGLYPYDAYFIVGTNEAGDNTNPDSERIFY